MTNKNFKKEKNPQEKIVPQKIYEEPSKTEPEPPAPQKMYQLEEFRKGLKFCRDP